VTLREAGIKNCSEANQFSPHASHSPACTTTRSCTFALPCVHGHRAPLHTRAHSAHPHTRGAFAHCRLACTCTRLCVRALVYPRGLRSCTPLIHIPVWPPSAPLPCLSLPTQSFATARTSVSSRPSVQCMLPNNYSFVPYLGSDWFSPSVGCILPSIPMNPNLLRFFQ
jgi:hypothetical protein